MKTKMNKYRVTVEFKTDVEVMVVAESEERAEEIALDSDSLDRPEVYGTKISIEEENVDEEEGEC